MTDIDTFVYDQRLQGLSKTTLAAYRWTLRGYPGSLTPPDLAEAKDYLTGLQERGLSSATVICRIRALKRYSAWRSEEAADGVDPLAKLKYPKQVEALPGRIAEDELIEQAPSKLSKWNDHPSNVRDHALVSLLMYTGCRRSEVARMRIEDVDFGASTISIPLAKGNRSRVVPLHPSLARTLRRWITQKATRTHASSPWLWPGLGGAAMLPDSISGALDALSKRCGLAKPLRCHEFRRRLASTWIQRGGTDPELMLICGWRSPHMAARYRREHTADLAIEQYQRLFYEEPRKIKIVPGPRKG